MSEQLRRFEETFSKENVLEEKGVASLVSHAAVFVVEPARARHFVVRDITYLNSDRTTPPNRLYRLSPPLRHHTTGTQSSALSGQLSGMPIINHHP